MDNSFFLSCINISQFAESQSTTVYLGVRYINDTSGLEARILNHCRVHTLHPTYLTHKYFCIDFIHAHSYNIMLTRTYTLALIVIVHPSPLHSCAPFNVSLSCQSNDCTKNHDPELWLPPASAQAAEEQCSPSGE